MLKIKKGYTFDDVLLIPAYSSIISRKDVNTKVNLGKGIILDIPIISANMQTVTGWEMAATLSSYGGMPILHRFFESDSKYLMEYSKSISTSFSFVTNNNYSPNKSLVGVSVGVQESHKNLIEKFINAGCKIICVDVAHGDSSRCIDMTRWINYNCPDILLISGNVATAEGAHRLADAGADVIKLNIGNGSLCTTRIETGNGVPTLTAISDVAEWRSKSKYNVKLICDGGMRKAGDIVKALCFTDCVMLGNLLAGTSEAPGETIIIDDVQYKRYVGSSTHKANHIEGVEALVKSKGPVKLVIDKLMDGIKSGCSYQGASSIKELQDEPEFIEISNSGLIESHPHDVRLL